MSIDGSNDPPKPVPPSEPSSQGLRGLDPGELLARGLDTVKPSGGASAWEPPTPEELSRLLPQYRIESLIGRGGMGAVYKGIQLVLDRPVAIKQPKPRNLEEALLNYQWAWGVYNKPTIFHANGEMTGLVNKTFWRITGPRTVALTRVGKTFAITFDDDFTRYESPVVDGHRTAPLSINAGDHEPRTSEAPFNPAASRPRGG